MLTFNYDEAKSQSNQVKHGIDFIVAQQLWKDPDLLEIPAKTSSLSDLTLSYCGKAPLLDEGGHFCCSFSLNSSLFASKDQQNWLKPDFPSLRTVKPDRLRGRAALSGHWAHSRKTLVSRDYISARAHTHYFRTPLPYGGDSPL